MKTKDVFQYCLAALIVLVVFVLIYVVFSYELPPGNKELGLLVIGALIAKFGDVVAYFFNSTKSSQEKTDIISKLPAIEKNV